MIEFGITCTQQRAIGNVYNLVEFDMNALIKLSDVRNFTSAFEASRRMRDAEDDAKWNSQHVQAENLHERFQGIHYRGFMAQR
jgi:hypothetical protein